MSGYTGGFEVIEEWKPRTKLGWLVKEGHITSMDEIFKLGRKIREVEIVDVLLPNLKEEVLDITLVQRQTDAGEMSRFRAVVAVGNEDGYVGVGQGKAPEIGVAIRKAIVDAKLNIHPVRRGCGAWRCGCGGQPHTVPFKVKGKVGSVEVIILPAPRGTGLKAGETARVILRLAGIKDAWTRTKGETRTTINFAKATFEALKNTYRIMTPADW